MARNCFPWVSTVLPSSFFKIMDRFTLGLLASYCGLSSSSQNSCELKLGLFPVDMKTSTIIPWILYLTQYLVSQHIVTLAFHTGFSLLFLLYVWFFFPSFQSICQFKMFRVLFFPSFLMFVARSGPFWIRTFNPTAVNLQSHSICNLF